jgi:predicted membrane metal-binding protein
MLFLSSLILLHLSTYFPKVSLYFHSHCLRLSPYSPYQELYQGIVCGKNLESASWQQTFAVTGLLHLLVVSGSHLLLIYSLARRLALPPNILLSLGFFYCLVCKVDAPIVRAYVFIALSLWNERQRWQWSTWHLHAISIVLCLCVRPSWVSSLSLQLSILCAFALSLTPHHKHLWVYLILFPALILLGNYHPLTVLMNIVLGPILGLVLFPLSALAFLLEPLVYVTDLFWKYLLLLLKTISTNLQLSVAASYNYNASIFWIYIIFLWILGRNFYYENRRRKSYSL